MKKAPFASPTTPSIGPDPIQRLAPESCDDQSRAVISSALVADPSGADKDCLDREHQQRLSAVAAYDDARDRKTAADQETGTTVEEEQALSAQRNALGTDEHLAAVERSRRFPDREAIRLGSLRMLLLDALLWATLWFSVWRGWRQLYEDGPGGVPLLFDVAGVVLIPVGGILCARGAKALGQHVAVTALTIPGSVDGTVEKQMRVAKRATIAGLSLVTAAILLTLIAQPSWASWLAYVNSVAMLTANCLLGLAVGVTANVARLLEKPAVRDAIDCAIDMKSRLRRRLQPYLATALLGLALAAGWPSESAASEPTWNVAVDVSDSMDPDDRARAIDTLVHRAPERARSLGVSRVMAVKFTSEARLAEANWIPVPSAVELQDCRLVRPAGQLQKGLLGLSPTLAKARKAEAVAACEKRQRALLIQQAEADEEFRVQLRAALSTAPRTRATTHIVPILRYLLARPYVRTVTLVTDGVDLSGEPLESLDVPPNVAVTMVITRPNPSRKTPTVRDVLTAADAWSTVDGITVTTVAEYQGTVALRGE